MAKAHEEELVFLPLGGCGEIGMNLNAYGIGPANKRKWIIVDVGVTFGDDTTPGIDLIMGDPTYLADQRENVLAIILTHGHEDHIGAIAYLWPFFRCPVYATPFTASLVEPKLVENGLDLEVPLKVIDLKAKFSIGPFDLEFINLTHSILEPNAISIRTSFGTVLHTGDWKIDPDPLIGARTDDDRLSELGEEGVLAMVCDSTNVFNPGDSGSEADVRRRLTEIIAEKTGRVAVTTFASNVARLDTVMQAAKANDRHVVLVGRAMFRVIKAARDNGYLSDMPELVSDDDAGYLPRDKVLFLCTGSQGEARAALSRIATGDHPKVSFDPGDTILFSSRVIPGNEKSIYRLLNLFAEQDIEVITEKDDYIHVSGHPCRDELSQMYSWVKPMISVPVHGEARHLKEHATFAKSLQVPQAVVTRNGGMVRLAPGPAEVIDHVPNGRMYVDGNILLPAETESIKERRKVSFNGAVMITIVVGDSGLLLYDPTVKAIGMPNLKGATGRTLVQALEDDLTHALENMSARDRMKDDDIDLLCRRTARARLKHAWGKRPQIDVEVIRLED